MHRGISHQARGCQSRTRPPTYTSRGVNRYWLLKYSCSVQCHGTFKNEHEIEQQRGHMPMSLNQNGIARMLHSGCGVNYGIRTTTWLSTMNHLCLSKRIFRQQSLRQRSWLGNICSFQWSVTLTPLIYTWYWKRWSSNVSQYTNKGGRTWEGREWEDWGDHWAG